MTEEECKIIYNSVIDHIMNEIEHIMIEYGLDFNDEMKVLFDNQC